MTDIYIVNYCKQGCTPFKSITRLNKQDAFDYAKELYNNNPTTSTRRFGKDFEWYYPKRIRTEKWLYDHFVALGGQPSTQHPIYFVLQGCDYLSNWFDNGHITQLTLEAIDSKDISFTFGDSMGMMDRSMRRPPITKDQLLQLLSPYGNIHDFLRDTCKGFNYIEAQLWNDRYIEELRSRVDT